MRKRGFVGLEEGRSMSKELKDPANFERIQRSIIETLQTTCSHNDVMEWAECPKCTDKMKERRALLKKLGFKNAGQYMAWRKVHEEIQARYPLVDWSKKEFVANL